MAILKRNNWLLFSILIGSLLVTPIADAHQSGCHRWHSCPSDTGSYICGDLGYQCQYPTYSDNSTSPLFRMCTDTKAVLERITKENKDLDDAQAKEVAAIDSNSWLSESLRSRKQAALTDKYQTLRASLASRQINYSSLYQVPCTQYINEAYQNLVAKNATPSPTPTPKPSVVKQAKQTINNSVFPNSEVPTVVKRVFSSVHGRNPTINESNYWKKRLREDKTTEASLKSTIKWHKAIGIKH